MVSLGLLSLLTWKLQPLPETPGKTRLLRVSDNNPLRKAQVDQFNASHPKFEVVIDPAGNNVEKVVVESMGGVGPDLFDCFDPFQLSAYVQAGIAWDITDELKKRNIDIQKEAFPGILPTCIFEGRTYGIPTNIAANAIWVHRDLLDESGIPVHKGTWKWSEFIPLAQKLTIRDAQGKPVRYGFYFDWWNYPHFFKGFGAHVYSPDGTRCIVDDAKSVAAVQLMHDLVYKYKVSSTPVEEASAATAGGFGSGSISIFGAKHAAMALGGRWWLATLRTYKGLHLDVMESPIDRVRQFGVAGRGLLINRESPKREQALEYLLSLAGPDYNNLVNDQADGITAFKKYTNSKQFLFNPKFPDETYNSVWRDVTDYTTGEETSPFVSGQVATRIMYDQLDLVKADQKTAEQAMKDAAAQINAEIQKTLAEDPKLAQRYNEVTKGGGK